MRINMEPTKRKWLVWSIEHDGWWRQKHDGYTGLLADAGRFSFEEALEICTPANYSLTLPQPKKFDKYLNTPHEAMVLEPIPNEIK
jgi:hypothetical protein